MNPLENIRKPQGNSRPLLCSTSVRALHAKELLLTESRSVTLLIADDDQDDRYMIREALEENRLSNDIRFVFDGEELMDYLLRKGRYANPLHSPTPGLILLDLNMPKKDGREALAEIRLDPLLRSIPVVILTTSQAEEDIVRSRNLGADGYITKPVTFEGLVEALREMNRYWINVVELIER